MLVVVGMGVDDGERFAELSELDWFAAATIAWNCWGVTHGDA